LSNREISKLRSDSCRLDGVSPCGERHLYRQDIREHVLTRHKDQRIYQCQRCEFLTDDLRETMVDHMIGEHDIRHPLCENVDFQHLATGELIKRMLSDAPIQNDSDNEVCLFIEIDRMGFRSGS